MKTRKKTSSGTSGTHVLSIKIICSPPKSGETNPLKVPAGKQEYRGGIYKAREFYSGGYIAQLRMCGPYPLPLDKVLKWPE